MEEFWRMVCSVPASILYYHGDTFDKIGLGWAPRTLLLSESNINTSTGTNMGVESSGTFNESSAKPTPKGLLIRFSGLVFTTSTTSISTAFLAEDENRKFYEIRCIWKESPYTRTFMEDQNGTFRHALGLSPALFYGSREVAFILLADTKNFNMNERKLFNETAIITSGILVAVNEERDGIIYAKKLCVAFRTMLKPSIDQLYGRTPLAEERNGILARCVGKTKPPGQQWCVD
jgi:hypothetical protein